MAKERCFEVIKGEHKGEYCKFVSSKNGILKLKLLGKIIEIDNAHCVERAVASYSPLAHFN